MLFVAFTAPTLLEIARLKFFIETKLTWLPSALVAIANTPADLSEVSLLTEPAIAAASAINAAPAPATAFEKLTSLELFA